MRSAQGLPPSTRRRHSRQAGSDDSWENPVTTAHRSRILNREQLVRAFFQPSRTQVLLAVILLLFGMGAAMQFRAKATDVTYSTASRADLVQILDNVNAESKRLASEIYDLERTKGELQSGADSARVAQEEAQRRLQIAQIMAGTVAAQGKGITITIYDPNNAVTGSMLLDAIEELRDAGAEVIAINGTIRVVASTWFANTAAGLVVDGILVKRPIRIDVIGDPQALEEAARFRGGVVSQVEAQTVGGSVVITRPNQVIITALHELTPNQFAKPA